MILPIDLIPSPWYSGELVPSQGTVNLAGAFLLIGGLVSKHNGAGPLALARPSLPLLPPFLGLLPSLSSSILLCHLKKIKLSFY